MPGRTDKVKAKDAEARVEQCIFELEAIYDWLEDIHNRASTNARKMHDNKHFNMAFESNTVCLSVPKALQELASAKKLAVAAWKSGEQNEDE